MKKIKKSRCDKSYERSLLGYRSTYLNPFIVLLDKVKKQAFENQKENIEKVRSSNIDFSKYGWVSEVAKLINKKHQKVNRWMKRYVPDIYDQKCFKRSSDDT